MASIWFVYSCIRASIPITINFGMKMPGWYDIKSLNKDGESDVEGLEETRAYCMLYINIIHRVDMQ